MSFKRYVIVPNGSFFYQHLIYECDSCKAEVDEMHHRYSVGDNDYCPDCSFLKGIISGRQYLESFGIYGEQYHAAIDLDGNIQIWSGKPKPPWERTKEQQRRTAKYDKWRTDVFERDNYTCQKCNKRGGELNAHHIKPFKDFPRLRTSIRNGVTLCVECHRKEHKKD